MVRDHTFDRRRLLIRKLHALYAADSPWTSKATGARFHHPVDVAVSFVVRVRVARAVLQKDTTDRA